jgi:alkylated DNA repair protein alkB homolog 1
MSSPNKDGTSAFKRAQVRYRRQGASPNQIEYLNELIDFSNPKDDRRVMLHRLDDAIDKDVYQGPLYGIKDFPGFLYAPQALSPRLQLHIAYLAVTEFCEKPHATNIESVPIKAEEEANLDERMWDLWKIQSTQSKTRERKPYRSFRKLAWATSGWQYDWTARAYHEDSKSPIPTILEELAQKFARASLLLEKSESTTFVASASIVNYYNLKSIMGGHRDDLEFAIDKPVVSMSVGLPGIFLLGGKTKDDSPVLPILVRPGDVMILGGDSRMNYHGMARVIPHNVPIPRPESLCCEALGGTGVSCVPADEMIFLKSFLTQHRININVRQVLPDGVDSIEDARNAKLGPPQESC